MPTLEQEVLRRLSVFRGGCPADAVLAVCVPGSAGAARLSPAITQRHLENLIDKGLLQNVFSGVSAEPRYLMLESIREYAGRKLVESGEADEVRQRHRDWCLRLAEQAEQNLRGPDQLHWLDRLEQEISNIRQALDLCVGRPTEVEYGLRLAVALGWFWHIHSHLRESCDWLDKLLAIELPADTPWSARRSRARALALAGTQHGLQHNLTRAMELSQASLNLFGEINDSTGLMDAKIGSSMILYMNGDVLQGSALVRNSSLCAEQPAIIFKWRSCWIAFWVRRLLRRVTMPKLSSYMKKH